MLTKSQYLKRRQQLPSVEEFISRSKFAGYEIFESDKTPYNLNIVGWRKKDGSPNSFEDQLAVYYRDSGLWFYKDWPITTRPGKPWLLSPSNSKGAAILVTGQYRGAYELGEFKGSPALLQVKPVRVYRDNDRDPDFDMLPGSIEEGLFGIHIHRGGVWTKFVGSSSAGCQVFQKSKDFFDFTSLVRQAVVHWGNSFSYTLMEY